MRVHLPEPLHGWRELAWEVGIIVIGVLIALGAQQIVEKLHWQAETRAARVALFSEAQNNLASAQFRQKQSPCVERRLGEIVEVFRRHAGGRPIKLTGPVRRPIPLGAAYNAWDVAVSSQAVGHMNLAEKLKFGDAFFNYRYWDQVQNREQEIWLTLGLLDNAEILTENDWSVLHQAYAQARSLNGRIQIIANVLLTSASLGETPAPVELPRTARTGLEELCAPILANEKRSS